MKNFKPYPKRSCNSPFKSISFILITLSDALAESKNYNPEGILSGIKISKKISKSINHLYLTTCSGVAEFLLGKLEAKELNALSPSLLRVRKGLAT